MRSCWRCRFGYPEEWNTKRVIKCSLGKNRNLRTYEVSDIGPKCRSFREEKVHSYTEKIA